jgi:Carboxypeptidase regulatory-like domain
MGRLVFAVALVGFVIGPCATASAQGERASIVGMVEDSSGGVLPGVTVEAVSPALIEQSRSVTTDSAGRYAIVDLRPGTYTVTFTLAGFKSVRREGIVLEGSFAAPVNAALGVGAMEETITVTGASPVVDVQNTRSQVVINQDVLQALPVMRSIQDQANLVPGVVSRSTSAGQILSDFYVNSMAARGATDQRIAVDGMRNDMLLGTGGQAIAGGVNELGQAEMVYDVGAQSAEFAVAGVRMDAIPKDGGNQFAGTWRVFGSNHSLQSDNLTPELRQAGLQAVNKLDFNWDNNVAAGGPIKQNKLWYFSAFELSQFNILVANAFFPDGTQADTGGHIKPNGTARLTLQATAQDKVSFAYNNTTSLTDRYDFSSTTSPEAGFRVNSPLNYSAILKWTRTATSRLLIEAGQSVGASTYHWEYQPENGPFDVAHRNQSTGVTTVASSTAPVENFNNSYNTVANVSYITGSHALKTGVNFTTGYSRTKVEPHGDMVRLNFLNNASGQPVASSVEVRNSPVTAREELKADLGMYVQDKWTRNRLTVTAGGRFDYLNAGVAHETASAGRFVPARESDAIPCVPCWRDWSIRFGGSYDLFGNGKTALKTSVGKYLASEALSRAQAVNPIRSVSETRTWTDLDGNGSALDAAGNAQYAEIGPKINANFGLPIGSTRFDPDTPRTTNWEETVSVVHELVPGVAVTGGYYHRSFQDLSLTRNVAIDPDLDYTPYTFVAPSDPRLPNGGAERITAYNLLPVKNGLVDSVSTFSSTNSRVYDGVEVSVNARLPRNGFLFGGITTERTATNDCDGPATSTNTPGGSNPDNLRFCDRVPPFRTLYKLSGGYTLPFDVQISGSLQAVPGASIEANYTYNSAVAGVTLTGANSRTTNLVEPNTMFYDYQTQLDGRASRSFRFGRRRVQAYVDVFNLLNASSVASVNQTFGANWLRPLVVMQARRFQLGARLDF